MIGRGKVDSILKYNAIGFDMDHTFIRYKLRSFIKLVYESTAIFLVNKKRYPQEVFPVDDDDGKMKFRMYFRGVFDHKTGNLLKIGSNNLIMRGYHGFRMLSRKEILDTYGQNPIIPAYEILSSKHDDFTNLHEFYGASLVPIIAQIVQLKSQEKFPILNDKNFYQIMEDIREAGEYNYAIKDFALFKNRDYTGNFFPKFLSEPRHYVNKTSQVLLDKLKKLKEKGIPIFIISNSYYEVANILMTEVIGPNWLDHFDFAIYLSAKPSFFKRLQDPKQFQDLHGQTIESFGDFFYKKKTGEEKVLIGGHASYFNEFMRSDINREFKILFFGDTIVSDCVYAFDKENDKNWDIILILEELQELENGYKEKEYFNYWMYWGSALQDKNIYSGVDKTIVFEFADNIAHRSFSTLDSKEALEFLTI